MIPSIQYMLTSQQTALMEFFEIGIGYNSKSWQLNEKGNNKKVVQTYLYAYVEYRNKTLYHIPKAKILSM